MERIYRIDQLLAGREAVPRAELQEKLSMSWATLRRDLAYMKDRLHAPIVLDRALGGYELKAATIQLQPFDKYLYVGTTRAAAYLVWTCDGAMPGKIDSSRSLFTANWKA